MTIIHKRNRLFGVRTRITAFPELTTEEMNLQLYFFIQFYPCSASETSSGNSVSLGTIIKQAFFYPIFHFLE